MHSLRYEEFLVSLSLSAFIRIFVPSADRTKGIQFHVNVLLRNVAVIRKCSLNRRNIQCNSKTTLKRYSKR